MPKNNSPTPIGTEYSQVMKSLTDNMNKIFKEMHGAGSGGGGGDSTLEPRVARIETDITYIKSDVKELKQDVKTIQANISSLDSKLQQQFNSLTINFTLIVLTMVGAIFAIMAFFKT